MTNTTCNGCCKTNTGYRTVVLTDNLEIRPVAWAKHSGYIPDRCTYQVCEPGDIIVTSKWGREWNKTEYFIYDTNPASISKELRAEIWKVLDLNNLREFLTHSTGRTSSILPIPEEKWLCNIAKKKKIEGFISRFGDILPDLSRDRKLDLRFYPRDLDIDLEFYIPHRYIWDGSCADVEEYEKWFVSNGDGSSKQIELDCNSKEGSNYAHTETVEKKGSPIKIPKGNKYAIRIKYGVYTSTHTGTHFSYGHQLDVWKLPRE